MCSLFSVLSLSTALGRVLMYCCATKRCLYFPLTAHYADVGPGGLLYISTSFSYLLYPGLVCFHSHVNSCYHLAKDYSTVHCRILLLTHTSLLTSTLPVTVCSVGHSCYCTLHICSHYTFMLTLHWHYLIILCLLSVQCNTLHGTEYKITCGVCLSVCVCVCVCAHGTLGSNISKTLRDRDLVPMGH